jgi:hypothetical protein
MKSLIFSQQIIELRLKIKFSAPNLPMLKGFLIFIMYFQVVFKNYTRK